jgi:hypothetical protein
MGIIPDGEVAKGATDPIIASTEPISPTQTLRKFFILTAFI